RPAVRRTPPPSSLITQHQVGRPHESHALDLRHLPQSQNRHAQGKEVSGVRRHHGRIWARGHFPKALVAVLALALSCYQTRPAPDEEIEGGSRSQRVGLKRQFRKMPAALRHVDGEFITEPCFALRWIARRIVSVLIAA